MTTGVHPAGFAAACLYKAGREQAQFPTQSDVSDAANVSATTIRNHRDRLQQLVDEHGVRYGSEAGEQATSVKSSG